MKTLFFLPFLILISIGIKAQRINIEPGIMIGVSYYMGDINHDKLFYSPQMSYGIMAKYNFNPFYTLRLDIIKATLSGSDSDFPNQYQQQRNWSFSNNIYEIGVQGEFNFLEFSSKSKTVTTTYITTGLAVFFAQSSSSLVNIAIPIGLGVKHSISKRMKIAAEWAYRNTFSDKLDLLPDNNYFPSNNLPAIKQITNDNSSDWYSLASVIITYNFKSSKKWCPAYQKK